MFSLSADHVAVPAHGTATVALTAELDKLGGDQSVSAMITGTDGSGAVRARTLIGAAREGQRQNLTVVAKDRSGKPLEGRVVLTAEHLFTVMDLDASGTGTARLPVGSYSGWLTGDVQGAEGPHSRGMVLLAFNDVKLDQDRTVTLDGRKARRILARVPRQTTAVARAWTPTGPSPTAWWRRRCCRTRRTTASGRSRPARRSPTASSRPAPASRLEQPALTVSTKSTTFNDPLVKRAATPLPAGTRNLTAVFAGDGTAEELARQNVRGQVSRCAAPARKGSRPRRRPPRPPAPGCCRSSTTASAACSPDEYPWSPESPAPVTVATLNADQGADLLGRLRHGAVSRSVTPPHDRLRHRRRAPRRAPFRRHRLRRSSLKDLGRVNVSFRNYRQGKAMEFRPDVWRGWAVGNQLTAPAQGERTDWVTAGTTWLDDAFIQGQTGQHSIDPLHYPARKTGKVSWFGPIQRPRMGPVNYQPVRYLDTMYITAPGWGDWGPATSARPARTSTSRTACRRSTRATSSSTGATPSTCRFPASAPSACPTGWSSTTTAAPGPTRTRRTH